MKILSGNRGTSKSFMFIGFPIINHPFRKKKPMTMETAVFLVIWWWFNGVIDWILMAIWWRCNGIVMECYGIFGDINGILLTLRISTWLAGESSINGVSSCENQVWWIFHVPRLTTGWYWDVSAKTCVLHGLMMKFTGELIGSWIQSGCLSSGKFQSLPYKTTMFDG